MPMANHLFYAAAAHSCRSSSKRPPDMSAWTRKALDLMAGIGAIQLAARTRRIVTSLTGAQPGTSHYGGQQ